VLYCAVSVNLYIATHSAAIPVKSVCIADC